MFVAFARGEGGAFLWEESVREWANLSEIDEYPANVNGVSVAVEGNILHVTVSTSDGEVFGSDCTVNPPPIDLATGCTDFVNLDAPAAAQNLE